MVSAKMQASRAMVDAQRTMFVLWQHDNVHQKLYSANNYKSKYTAPVHCVDLPRNTSAQDFSSELMRLANTAPINQIDFTPRNCEKIQWEPLASVGVTEADRKGWEDLANRISQKGFAQIDRVIGSVEGVQSIDASHLPVPIQHSGLIPYGMKTEMDSFSRYEGISNRVGAIWHNVLGFGNNMAGYNAYLMASGSTAYDGWSLPLPWLKSTPQELLDSLKSYLTRMKMQGSLSQNGPGLDESCAAQLIQIIEAIKARHHRGYMHQLWIEDVDLENHKLWDGQESRNRRKQVMIHLSHLTSFPDKQALLNYVTNYLPGGVGWHTQKETNPREHQGYRNFRWGFRLAGPIIPEFLLAISRAVLAYQSKTNPRNMTIQEKKACFCAALEQSRQALVCDMYPRRVETLEEMGVTPMGVTTPQQQEEIVEVMESFKPFANQGQAERDLLMECTI